MSFSDRGNLSGFEKFCGGVFWDERLTWTGPNITWPQFTPCFLETVFPWIPCFWLWVTLPISLVWLFGRQGTPFPISKLTIAKTVVGLILVLISVIEIILAATHNIYRDTGQEDESVPLMWFITPTIKALSFLLSVILIHVERKLGFITSGFQFFFYLLAFLTNIIPFYTNIFYLKGEGMGNNISVAPISLFYVEVTIVIIQWFLHFPAERLPKEEYGITVKGPSPEILASFVSRFTFTWLTQLILTGYRKALDETDVWDPNPRDRSSKVVPEFDAEWSKEVARVKRINDKKEKKNKGHKARYFDENVLLNESSEKTPLLSQQGGRTRTRAEKYDANRDTGAPSSTADAARVVPKEEQKKAQPGLFKIMVKLYGITVFQAFCIKLLFDFLQFSNPLILRLLIEYTEDKTIQTWKGYLYMTALFFCTLVLSSCFHQTVFIDMTLGMRIKAAVIAAVYKKALTMSSVARKTSTVGEIVNLMSVDAQRLQDVTGYLWMLWSPPIQITLALVLLYNTLGIAMVAGLVLMIILLPFNLLLAIKMRTYQVEQMKQKDSRIKLINEVLNGIKVLKLYAWEPSFHEKIEDIRRKELSVLRKIAFLNAFSTVVWTCAPFLITLATFATYILSAPDNYLDASTAFVSLSLLNILRGPMNMLPLIISYLVQASVSIGRVRKFLSCDELDFNSIDHNQNSKDPITVADGTFAWDQTERICLKNINLTVPDGSLVAVVGHVGSGKSSLISAILGEMEKPTGRVNVRGRIAYIAQQAWIQNATVRDNITFGKDFQQKRYDDIVDACALRPDFAILSAGDQTEIGEKGINLSGGQKQRISVARAVYNDADIYLLDDPLSAVDSHVGKHMFEQVIGKKGILKNKSHEYTTYNRTGKRYFLLHGEFQNMSIELQRREPTFLLSLPSSATPMWVQSSFIPLVSDMHTCCSHALLGRVLTRELIGNNGIPQYGVTPVKSLLRTRPLAYVAKRPGLRTRILVTHGIHWLPMVDQILVMNDGEISEIGSYEELMSHHGAFARFIETYLTQEVEGSDENDEDDPEVHESRVKILEHLDTVLSQSGEHTDEAREQISRSIMRSRKLSRVRKPSVLPEKLAELSKSIKKQEKEKAGDKLIEEEKAETGQVKFSVYLGYCRALGAITSFAIIGFFVTYYVFSVVSNIWLSSWTEDPLLKNRSLTKTPEYQDKNHRFLIIYALLGAAQAVFVVLYALSFAVGQIRASSQLHGNMLKNILRSPMSFFDTTPIGRIVNRFSRDVETIDNNLPQIIQMFLNTFFMIVSNIFMVSYSTPIFIAVLVPLIVLYFLIQRFYIATSRQLKRVESTSRSPIYNHFSETVNGASTIRAYGVQDRFIHESESRVDRNLIFYFSGTHASRWLGIRIEFLGNLLVIAATLFAILGRDTLSGGLVGMSVSYALQVTTVLTFTVRQMSDLETNIVSVERMKEYTETPTEPEWYNPETKPPANWPQNGNVQFNDYMTRYRPGLDLVLRGITCEIKPKEKVGIVGRTGAGKSSLTVALFRLIEGTSGSIVIDDVTISELGLHDLRAKLTILPQDPVLFSGTLRMNLDPFDSYTDEQVWRALEHAHLKNFVEALPTSLLYECGEGGQNLSVGQRQLVCLARTLLRKTKILILDEATAAVDMETDDLIQHTIQTEFSECTVISIAHRLNTIMDYDRIMVLDNGYITEYDSPAALMKNKHGVFYGMAKDAGLV